MPFEALFKLGTLALANGVELVASLVIAAGVLQAGLGALLLFVHHRAADPAGKVVVRLRLGRWLALALEFELAADILRTAVAPTWNEIGQLAAIVVLRTTLNYFLEREIEHAVEPEKVRHV